VTKCNSLFHSQQKIQTSCLNPPMVVKKWPTSATCQVHIRSIFCCSQLSLNSKCQMLRDRCIYVKRMSVLREDLTRSFRIINAKALLCKILNYDSGGAGVQLWDARYVAHLNICLQMHTYMLWHEKAAFCPKASRPRMSRLIRG
jgi:hypothetical protein